VVETRSAVQQHQGWLLAHEGAVRHEFGAFDIEEQANAIHHDMHACPSVTRPPTAFDIRAKRRLGRTQLRAEPISSFIVYFGWT
jgi:hypothetical protein